MHATYTFAEIKKLIRSCNHQETNLLNELVEDEMELYAHYECRALFRMILLRKKALSQNTVQVNCLLAYN